MSLPSGYTRLRYIQSSGTQYINTEFIPNQDTRVVCDFQMTVTTGGWPIFGSRYSGSKQTYTFGSTSTNNCWVSGYNASGINSGVVEDAKRHTVDKNKNICYLDGTAIATSAYAAFTCPSSLWLFRFYAGDGDNAVYGKMLLFSCQIYDNGTMVRDFVPAKNSGGTVGLYDTVNGVFYTNAGTGAFAGEIASGPVEGAGASLVDGVSYGINGGKCMVGGTAYAITEGKTMVGGTAYLIGESVPGIPVTITGSGNASTCYATINGKKYTAATSGVEVFPGDVITLCIYSAGKGYNAYLYIDETRVATATNQTKTYNWTVPEGKETIDINLSAGSNYTNIRITTT